MAPSQDALELAAGDAPRGGAVLRAGADQDPVDLCEALHHEQVPAGCFWLFVQELCKLSDPELHVQAAVRTGGDQGN
ncbi:MAG TPA: hypothetical protein VFN61_03145 [Acidimicrobiales bacterium]|nr:hypothetical protein [Acidimicrobiales bacterium]